MDNNKLVGRHWKILAWTFIILFIVETASVVWLLKIGTDSIKREQQCEINVCGDAQYNSYYFDSPANMCYCYTNSVMVHQELMK